MAEQADIHELLAPYALDALDGAELVRFESHLASCGRCRDELPGLRSAAEALAFDLDAPDPPAGLRERIVASARAEGAASRETARAPRRRRTWTLPTAAALAVAAACAAVGLGIWAAALASDLARARAAHRVDTRALAIVSDPSAARFPLVGATGSVVVTSRRDAALVVSRLARAPKGQTYELWIVLDQRPRPAGIFPGGGERSLVALTRKVPHSAQISVSLEPAGGSSTLTGNLLFGAQTL